MHQGMEKAPKRDGRRQSTTRNFVSRSMTITDGNRWVEMKGQSAALKDVVEIRRERQATHKQYTDRGRGREAESKMVRCGSTCLDTCFTRAHIRQGCVYERTITEEGI